jgi:hypothetical protein
MNSWEEVMQIYYLDNDPRLAAQYHPNKLVVKMITESLQILSTVCYIHNQPELAVYKKTHENHPSVVWASESIDNYLWLYDLTHWLYEEYKLRYGKTHLAGEKFEQLGIPYIKQEGLTPIRYGFKDPTYQLENRVEGYRKYLCEAKSHIMQYSVREKPEWM